MSIAEVAGTRTRTKQAGRIGVVDVGSNSVRLVVYEGAGRNPAAMFNEKVLCGLGRRLASTGKLDAEGVVSAHAAIERFVALSRVMGVRHLDIVATAAVRDANDGADFVAKAEELAGTPIRVLSGQEEAYFSAEGVLSAIPEADGLVGDLGGGSLEVVLVGGGQVGAQATLPLGPLRLLEATQGDKARASEIIDQALAGLPWLDQVRGRSFFAVGGAWRALAKIHMAQTSYPLRVLHHYRIMRGDVRDLSRVISNLSRESLERISGLSRRRLDTLPLAALILDRVLKATRPRDVVFSSYGLREGLLFSRLSARERALDPLIDTSVEMGARLGRFAEHGEELAQWMTPLFGDESPAEKRLRLATCHVSDIGWRNHPDYRAQQTLFEILRGPFVGIDHPGRAQMALAIYARYDGDPESGAFRQASAVMDERQVLAARVIGASLRLGHCLTGGTPGILCDCPLSFVDDGLVLTLAARHADLDGEVVQRRLGAIGRLINRPTKVVPAA
ncbi:Ppx/GppA family phosphatase [Zavarzinia sp.]|uniref:Ppx/GppA phosphatase family protein n=1 Tax=Zavarzinia sp. TaxID=2027920 RepID=UPI003563637F